MPISYKNKIYTTLGTPTVVSGNGTFVTNSAGVPAKDYTVKGKSIVWNQLFTNSATSSNGVTISNNQDGTMTLNGTANVSWINFTNLSDAMNQVHKYLLCLKILNNPDNVPFHYGWLNRGSMTTGVISNGESCSICNQTETLTQGGKSTGLAGFKTGTVFNNVKIAVMVMDLTQMFGAGNEPATVAEFRAMFPDYYYPYNAGELKSVVPTSVETSTAERFQLLDKSKFTATTTINGVTFTNNGDGTITYNGTTTGANYTLQSGLMVVAGHKYFSYVGENTNNKISVLLYADPDPYNTFDERFPKAEGGISTALKNCDRLYYQPKPLQNISYSNFILKPQFFDLTEMFGAGNEPTTPAEFWQRVPEKLYGYNPSAYKSVNISSSKYFPDGMRSAGSAYDEINFLSQKAIKRIGAVDMGTLNWSYSTTRTAFQTNDLNTKIEFPVTSSETANLICTKYSAESYASGWAGTIDKCCGTTFATATKWFWVRDTAYTDAAAFKSAMSGVMLYYELATPIETTITPPLQALPTYKGFTSFSAPNSLMKNGPLSVTYYAEGGANPEKGWLTSYKRKLYMGRNIEWNQLFTNSRTSSNGVTISNNQDGTMTLNGTATATYINFTNLSDAMNQVHKYLLCLKILNNPDNVSFSYGWLNRYKMNTGIISNGESCVVCNQTESLTQMEKSTGLSGFTAGTVFNNVKIAAMVMDLTKMFGVGNEPATPEEFWSYFDHKLYLYNAGETQQLFKISRKSQWGSTVSYPNKGDLINIEGKQYRVLKTNGSVAEVLAMYNATNSQKFDTKSSYTNIYANNALDVYCNQTFYNSLSTAMQNAIVSKDFRQDSWVWDGGTSAIANYVGTGRGGKYHYTMSLMSMAYGDLISRKCYVLSVQDVIDYFEVTTSMNTTNTTLTDVNIWKMFWNQTTSPNNSESQWLRSAYADPDEDGAVVTLESSGELNYSYASDSYPVRPAFQIDLSKVAWTKQG